MAVGDVAVLRVLGTYQNQNIVNTLHYRIITEGSTPQSRLDSLCQQWSTDLQAVWIAAHIDTYELSATQANLVKGNAIPPGEFLIAAAGTVSGVPSPAVNCRTITLYSDSSNHRRRGRVMLSGSDDGDFAAGTGIVVSGAMILMQAIGDALLDSIEPTGDEWALVLYDKATDTTSDIIKAKARPTMSVVTSRRGRPFDFG